MSPRDADSRVAGTEASYDVIAAAYDAANATTKPEFAAWRSAWAASLPQGSWVLDAGAGPGRHAAALAAYGLRVLALDLSASMARLAFGRGMAVVRGDLRRLPLRDGAVDGVWSSASLLHVPRGDVAATLAGWRRVVRPDGSLALGTATGGTDGWEDPPYDVGDAHPPPRWYTYHDEPGLRALLDAAGWGVTSVERRSGSREWLLVRATAR